MRFAVVEKETGNVINIIIAEEDDAPHEGVDLIELRETDPIDNSGWVYDSVENTFTKVVKAK